jgi:hypothetical protein
MRVIEVIINLVLSHLLKVQKKRKKMMTVNHKEARFQKEQNLQLLLKKKKKNKMMIKIFLWKQRKIKTMEKVKKVKQFNPVVKAVNPILVHQVHLQVQALVQIQVLDQVQAQDQALIQAQVQEQVQDMDLALHKLHKLVKCLEVDQNQKMVAAIHKQKKVVKAAN